MGEPAAGRQDRERQFHDELFAHGRAARDDAGRFSSVVASSRALHQHAVDARNAAADCLAGEPATGIARFEQAEGERLPFGDESFDPAFGYSVLHHLELAPAVAGTVRVLLPSGAAVSAEPCTVPQGPVAADHPHRA